MRMRVPFVDLNAQYLNIKNDIDTVIKNVIDNSSFIRGPYVEEFEVMFSKAMETKYCVSCANGTDSLYIAMKGLNIKPGDEVIAPAHSWISTTETITQAGGKVIFCDTELDSFNIDVNLIESKITEKTVGIIPVHLYGQPADMDKIMNLSEKYNLWVIEDCAQAHYAKYKGRQVGTFGNIASFSFYPGKNLGAMGDAGAAITNDLDLANKMTRFARHGGLKKGEHIVEGINSRMDGIQAAILSVKLPHLKKWTELRQDRAERYTKLLSDIKGIKTPKVSPENDPVWHLYVIKCENRDRLAEFLNKKGISTVINYPVALPFLPAYKYLNHVKYDFPNAFSNQSQILSLPIYPELTDSQMDYVVESINEFFLMQETS
jgi:dTDP-4-amino-4,6-dideoxygalactose transaminase